ncbi:MAG: cupin domain-containing protein [Gammaproteobacteria bacterium]|nr:cupin domain-containing protein [Gammaproteobacteria bacterium]
MQTLLEIELNHQPSAADLAQRGVLQWPIWEKEVSAFAWTYDSHETCYFLQGEVIVTPDGGTPVRIGEGDLVTFPSGMRCTWQVLHPVRKHYHFFD